MTVDGVPPDPDSCRGARCIRTCDEAFDILTSPAAASSAGLHAHLQICPRCRDLQEALAPALQILSGEHAAQDSLPWMHSEQTARAAANRLSISGKPRSSGGSWHWKVLATLLVGAGVAAGLSVRWFGSPATAAAIPATSPVCLWQTHDVSVFEGHPDSQAVIMTCIACHLDHSTASAASLP